MDTPDQTCFSCEEGVFEQHVSDYQIELSDGNVVVVPQLLIERCNHCGEESFPPDSCRRIDSALEESEDVVLPADIAAFLKRYGIDQTEAAEALGLGAKTIHRWAKGTQRASRSMSFFLRAMIAHPKIFEWVQNRRWRNRGTDHDPVVAYISETWNNNYELRFPAMHRSQNDYMVSQRFPGKEQQFNAALAFVNAVGK